MRKLIVVLAAITAFGMALPIAAQAREGVTVVVKKNNGERNRMHSSQRVVIVKRDHDRGLHRGFTHSRHYGYDKPARKIIIVKSKHRD